MTEKLTRRERRDLMRESIVPVLLDQSKAAHLLAWRLFWRWGVTSFLCGEKKSPLTSLDPVCHFLRTDRGEARLAAEQLTDFTESARDCLFLLVPLTEADRAFAAAYAPALESRMIVADPQSIFRHAPFEHCH